MQSVVRPRCTKFVEEVVGHEDRNRTPGDAMSWQQLAGKRVRVDGEIARVVHVDSFRIILETEPKEGVSPHRIVISQDDLVCVEAFDEPGGD